MDAFDKLVEKQFPQAGPLQMLMEMVEKELNKFVPKEILEELKALDIDLFSAPKPIDPLADKKAGREFILKHTEEFLHHVVDYSMMVKIKE